jgi:hypothetical protein
MTLAVIAADTHISDNTWTSRLNIRGDSFFGFKQLIDLCVQHECPLVLAGDCLELLRDGRPSANTVCFLRRQCDRLHNMGLKLYYVNGQHDGNSTPSWLSAIHDSCVHVGNSRFKLGDFDFYGIDYWDRAFLGQVVSQVPGDIYGLVVHQPWLEFAGNRAISEMSLAMLPKVPLVISGDMHQFKHGDIAGRLCVSTGATHMRTLKEPTQHYCVLLQDDGALLPVALKSRPVAIHKIEDEVSWAGEVEAIAANMEKLFENAIQSGIVEEVAKPLLIVDEYCKANSEEILQERIPQSHVIVRDRFEKDRFEGVLHTPTTIDEMSQSDNLETFITVQLDKARVSQIQRDIILGLYRRVDVKELLLNYAKRS